jgi:hypothetical protein
MKSVRLALLFVVTAFVAQAAMAGFITYTESFPTNVDPFPGTTDYPEWTVAKWASGSLNQTIKVVSGTSTGMLDIAAPNSGGGVIRRTSVYVTALSAFGVDDFGDDVTVSADMGAVENTGTAAGNQYFALRIGNLAVGYLPGYSSSGSGLFRYYNVTDTTETYKTQDTMTGFVPTRGTPLAQHLIAHLVRNGSNWDVTVTLTEGSNTFTKTSSWADSIVTGGSGTGLITKAGAYSSIGAVTADDYYDNFQVKIYSQIPEPSTLVLLAGGLVGLLAYAWRKRK